MFDTLWTKFSKDERIILQHATADDILAPDDQLGVSVPVKLRAKFMALVIRSIPAIPLKDLSIYTDPQ